MVYTPKPSNNQTAKAINPITTTAATSRSFRRPYKNLFEPEVLVASTPLVGPEHDHGRLLLYGSESNVLSPVGDDSCDRVYSRITSVCGP